MSNVSWEIFIIPLIFQSLYIWLAEEIWSYWRFGPLPKRMGLLPISHILYTLISHSGCFIATTSTAPERELKAPSKDSTVLPEPSSNQCCWVKSDKAETELCWEQQRQENDSPAWLVSDATVQRWMTMLLPTGRTKTPKVSATCKCLEVYVRSYTPCKAVLCRCLRKSSWRGTA